MRLGRMPGLIGMWREKFVVILMLFLGGPESNGIQNSILFFISFGFVFSIGRRRYRRGGSPFRLPSSWVSSLLPSLCGAGILFIMRALLDRECRMRCKRVVRRAWNQSEKSWLEQLLA